MVQMLMHGERADATVSTRGDLVIVTVFNGTAEATFSLDVEAAAHFGAAVLARAMAIDEVTAERVLAELAALDGAGDTPTQEEPA